MNEILQWVAIAITLTATVISIALSLRQEAHFDDRVEELEHLLFENGIN